jgi:hypothetical protein
MHVCCITWAGIHVITHLLYPPPRVYGLCLPCLLWTAYLDSCEASVTASQSCMICTAAACHSCTIFLEMTRVVFCSSLVVWLDLVHPCPSVLCGHELCGHEYLVCLTVGVYPADGILPSDKFTKIVCCKSSVLARIWLLHRSWIVTQCAWSHYCRESEGNSRRRMCNFSIVVSQMRGMVGRFLPSCSDLASCLLPTASQKFVLRFKEGWVWV